MSIHNDFGGPLAAESTSRLAERGFVLTVSPPRALARLLTTRGGGAVELAVTGFALVDPGASCCCVEESVLHRLQLQPIRQTEVRSPNGSRLQSVYLARLSFPGSPISPVELPVVGVQMGDEQTVALIGRDFLRRCLLVYNGPAGACTLSF